MKVSAWSRFGLLVLPTLGLSSLSHSAAGDPTGDLIVIARRDSSTLNSFKRSRALSAYLMREVPAINMSVVRPPAGTHWRTLQKSLLQTGLFESVLPDTVAMPTSLTNDPELSQQWHLFHTSWPRAMDQNLVGTGPIVAVVDSGVDPHPDLVPNLVPGYNAVLGVPQSSGGSVVDVAASGGHGTRVAGVIGARGNNGLGVTGVSPFCRLMPVCVSTSTTGSSSRSVILAGLSWAAQNGAKIANVSFSEVQFPDVEATAATLRNTYQLNVVWSAGNSNDDWSTFDHRNVTVVGGTDELDMRWVYPPEGKGSGYGLGVDIFAPCTDIYSTRKAPGFYGLAPNGTSFATPQVAGALALVRQLDPTLTAEQAEYRVLRYGRDLGAVGNDPYWGNGRLNIGASALMEGRRYVLTEINNLGFLGGPTSFPALYRLGEHGNVAGLITSGSMSYLAVWSPPYTGVPNILPPDVEDPHRYIVEDAEDTSPDAASLGIVGWYYKDPDIHAMARVPGQPQVTFRASGSLTKPFGLKDTQVVGEHASDDHGNPESASGFSANISDLDSLTFPLTQPPYSFTGDHVIFKKRPLGFIGTRNLPSNEFWVFTQQGSAVSSLYVTTFPNFRGYITDANDSSDFLLNARVTDQPHNTGAYLFNGIPNLVQTFGFNQFLWGINNSSDIVGSNFLTPLDPVTNGPTFATSNAYIYRGLGGSGPFANFVQGSYPGVTFREVRDINNSGTVIVNADSPSGRKAYVGQPTGSTFAGINFGQFGANPTYIGSIPPSLSITYASPEGQAIPGGPYIVPYGQNPDGRVLLPQTTSLGDPYRVLLRCQPDMNPGYFGPKFLAKLYPPLSEPPLPPDTTYIPYSGSPSQSGPLLVMYTGDADYSGEVDAADLDMVISKFGLVSGQAGWTVATDMDASGEIDAVDIDITIQNFGLTDDVLT